MDDELCDTVVMGAVQLQATFSVVALIHHGFGANNGAHLSKGCTRGTTGVRRVLPSLRVLRFTTITVALAQSVTLSTRRSLSHLYDVL
jgi:hypothetical protein